MSDTRTKVRDYILRSLQGYHLEDDDNIFEAGLVHSLFAMQIIVFIEKEFGIELDLDEIGLASLSSIDALTSLVEASPNPACAASPA